MPTRESNERFAELLRRGQCRADADGVRGIRPKHFEESELEEMVELLHAYLSDTALPHRGGFRSAGNIMTLWAELLDVVDDDRARRRYSRLRDDLVKELTARGLAERTHPRSTPLLVSAYSGNVDPPVHVGDPREDDASIAVGAWGAGFGDPATNRVVEMAAERAVTARYEEAGWAVHRVAHLRCGWDLTATRRSEELHLEVKGVRGDRPSILLTRNEVATAETDPAWTLVVVTNALSSPTVTKYPREVVRSAIEPTVFRATLSPPN